MEFSISGLHLHFSAGRKSKQLNGLFKATGVNDMVWEMDYHFVVDIVFFYVAAFIDHATEYTGEHGIKDLLTAYSDLDHFLLFHRDDMKHRA